MSEQTQPLPYLGRCDGCDFALFASAEDIKVAESWKDVSRTGLPYKVRDYGVFARCPNRHKVFRLKQIKGTFSEDHKCDARCLNAKGNECTCSCGGINHGRGHAVVFTASTRDPKHIGEVGKNIVGIAVCSAIAHPRENLYIYEFRTDNGDTIKHFAHSADLPFEQGEKYKIRAKVTRHDDHERFGKSTIVDTPEIVEEQLKLDA